MHLSSLNNGSCQSKCAVEVANLINPFPFSCTCQEYWMLQWNTHPHDLRVNPPVAACLSSSSSIHHLVHSWSQIKCESRLLNPLVHYSYQPPLPFMYPHYICYLSFMLHGRGDCRVFFFPFFPWMKVLSPDYCSQCMEGSANPNYALRRCIIQPTPTLTPCRWERSRILSTHCHLPQICWIFTPVPKLHKHSLENLQWHLFVIFI